MLTHFFWKTTLPKAVPKELHSIIQRLKKSKSKEACAKEAYSYIRKTYHGCIPFRKLGDYFRMLPKRKNGRKIRSHCTNLNMLYRFLLIKSEKFSENDIRLAYSTCWLFSPHQYLKIRMGKKWVHVDPWASSHGIRFGDHAHGWHWKTKAI